MKATNAVFPAVLSAVLLLTACGGPSVPGSSSASSASASSALQEAAGSSGREQTSGIITPEDGAALLEAKLGSVDEMTGNAMSYGYESTITLDGTDYYNYRVSWLVDNSHLSYLTNYLVSTDGSDIREYVPDQTGNNEETELESAASSLLSAMADEDFSAIAQWVDEENGVTFTPYSTVDTASDRTVSASDLAAFSSDAKTHTWGSYDGSGNPIELTNLEYWSRFVWNTDYTQAADVSVNEIAQSGNSPENVQDAYPDAQFVEYHFSGLNKEYEGADWCSLKLVFLHRSGAWKLVGIIHSEMTV